MSSSPSTRSTTAQNLVTRELFYRGILCALAERRRILVQDDSILHDAFGDMLEHAVRVSAPVPAEDLLRDFDPMFGVHRGAMEMIRHGEFSLMLSFHKTRICFDVSADSAGRELDLIPCAGVLRDLARVFDERMFRARISDH